MGASYSDVCGKGAVDGWNLLVEIETHSSWGVFGGALEFAQMEISYKTIC